MSQFSNTPVDGRTPESYLVQNQLSFIVHLLVSKDGFACVTLFKLAVIINIIQVRRQAWKEDIAHPRSRVR